MSSLFNLFNLIYFNVSGASNNSYGSSFQPKSLSQTGPNILLRILVPNIVSFSSDDSHCPYFLASQITGLYTLRLASFCVIRDFVMGNRKKYTFFADVILLCISTSFFLVNSVTR